MMTNNDLTQTTDAPQWARAFVRMVNEFGHEVDEDLMRAWFANAIETGRTFGYQTGLRDAAQRVREAIEDI
jgi:hypothetical protein